MLYVFNEYRVLDKVLRRGYVVTGNGTNNPPYIDDIKIRFITHKGKYRHLAYLCNMKYLDIYPDYSNFDEDSVLSLEDVKSVKFFVAITDKGREFHQQIMLRNANTMFTCIWSIVSLAIGVVIGKLF